MPLDPTIALRAQLDVEAIHSGSPSALSPAIPKASRLLCASKYQPWSLGQGPPTSHYGRTVGQTFIILSYIIIMSSFISLNHTALNLILCYYGVSDSEKMKKCFNRMLQISTGIDEDRYYPTMVCKNCSMRMHVSVNWASLIEPHSY